ncbi:MAG: amidoligase family protein [Aeromonas sp.]
MRTVMQWFGVHPQYETKGDLGIEIEVEGRRLPDAPRYWKREHDGSLRGPENAEYVFSKPLSKTATRTALALLDRAYVDNNSEVHDTVRAGIHVHVNVQDLNIIELYNMMTIYMVLEPLLIKHCGEGREGNLFCLRATDAKYLLYSLKVAARQRAFRHLVSDNLRYASMNVKALGTYGSLEFRAMRGTRDIKRIEAWAMMLLGLREKAQDIDSPNKVVELYSQLGAAEFVKQFAGDLADELMNNFPDYEALTHKGMRCAQQVAYAVNWDAFRPEEPKKPEEVDIGGLKFPKGVWFDEPQFDW